MSGRCFSSLARLPGRRFKGKLRFKEIDAGRFLGGASVIHLVLPPRTSLPDIQHRRTAELIYCLSGRATAEVSGRRRPLRPGSLVYIRPGAWHRFETGASGCEALALFSPPLRIRRGADIHGRPGVDIWR